MLAACTLIVAAGQDTLSHALGANESVCCGSQGRSEQERADPFGGARPQFSQLKLEDYDENFASPAAVLVAPGKGATKAVKASGGGAGGPAPKPAAAPSAGAAAPAKSKSIEQMYQKKTQLEHILLRPDSYIGSIQKHTSQQWVWDGAAKRITPRVITYVPGLYKIFDEILVNAADNKQRDPSMSMLKVSIDAASNTISVWNNGRAVPVAMHAEHNVYVPELIFGHLLTSSNYDDDEKKVTGGRNGYGAKLANIFSTAFTVETGDTSRGKRYAQTFTKNMTVTGPPAITPYAAPAGTSSSHPTRGDFTCITFCPDLPRFGMEVLDADTVALFTRRVVDMAGVLGKSVTVLLNGERVGVSSFLDYVNLYTAPDAKPVAPGTPLPPPPPRVWERINDRWEVAVGITDGSFAQTSFVNAICTTRGGAHVTYVTDQITAAVAAAVNKAGSKKGIDVKPAAVRNFLHVFVNCLIENPAFDSQTKDTLNTREKDFGSTAALSPRFIKDVLSTGITDRVNHWAAYQANLELQKVAGVSKKAASGRLVGIPKLDDANYAGSAKAGDCTLILTEGDSAKSLAIAGLSVVGRDYYGVFPLKGKLLNVREASHKQITANTEIQNIVKILGLQYGTVYTSAKSLRYGHLMIMSDQDHDGSHIKGLVLNFLHHFWPSLLALPGFLRQFITPILKAVRGKEEHTFFTIPEFTAWKEAQVAAQRAAISGKGAASSASSSASSSALKGWSVKYYKGLGTSTAAEAKAYFADLDKHQIDFALDDPATSLYNAADLIDLAFSKKRADDRKEWLRSFVPGTHVNYAVERMLVSDFIHKELILFSVADNVRSIPSMVDGLKPAQRKVLFACFKRNLRSDIKVAQLAGYVSEHAAYHHGEAALASTIIGMAQNFVGSNNINLLVPSGQFGTRLQGGKDAASPRYIFTRLAPIARAIFHPDDDAILSYLDEDGQSIEPVWYMPVIPLVLVNGADGIGTGWSSTVTNYNPRDVIAALRARIGGNAVPELTPWYRGFKGVIERKDATHFVASGVAEVAADGETLRVTELPVRKWTQDYKQLLVGYLTGQTAATDKDEDAGLTSAAAKKKKAAAAAAARKAGGAGKAAAVAAAAAAGAAAAGKRGGGAAAAAAKKAGAAAPAADVAEAVEAVKAPRAAATKAKATLGKKKASKKAADSDDEDDDDSDDDSEEEDAGSDFSGASSEEEDDDDAFDSDDDDDDSDGGRRKAPKKKAGGAPKAPRPPKEPVEPLVPPGEPLVKSFNENHTDTTVDFTVKLTPATAKVTGPCAGAGPGGITPALRKLFKLDTPLNTGNMHLFDPEGTIHRYGGPSEVLEAFYTLRLTWYEKRKAFKLGVLGEEVERLSNRVRFILAVVSGDLRVANRPRAELLAQLHDDGYKGFEAKPGPAGASSEEGEDAEAAVAAAAALAANFSTVGKAGRDIPEALLSARYSYLLNQPLWSLTMEKVKALRAELAEKEETLAALQRTPAVRLWLNDLDALEAALDAFEAESAAAAAGDAKALAAARRKAAKAVGKGSKAGGKAGGKGGKKAAAWDSDDDSEESEEEEDDDDDWDSDDRMTGPRVPVATKSGRVVAPAGKPKAVAPAPAAPVIAPVAASAAPPTSSTNLAATAAAMLAAIGKGPKAPAPVAVKLAAPAPAPAPAPADPLASLFKGIDLGPGIALGAFAAPAATAAATTMAASKPAAAPVASSSFTAAPAMTGLSLAERIAARLGASTAVAAPAAPVPTSVPAVPQAKPVKPAAVVVAPKVKAAPVAAAPAAPAAPVAAAAAPAARPARAAASAPRSYAVDSDDDEDASSSEADDDDFDFDDGSDSDAAAKKKKKAAAKAKGTSKPAAAAGGAGKRRLMSDDRAAGMAKDSPPPKAKAAPRKVGVSSLSKEVTMPSAAGGGSGAAPGPARPQRAAAARAAAVLDDASDDSEAFFDKEDSDYDSEEDIKVVGVVRSRK